MQQPLICSLEFCLTFLFVDRRFPVLSRFPTILVSSACKTFDLNIKMTCKTPPASYLYSIYIHVECRYSNLVPCEVALIYAYNNSVHGMDMQASWNCKTANFVASVLLVRKALN